MSSKKVQNLANRLGQTKQAIEDIDGGFEAVLVAHYGAERLAQIRASRASNVKVAADLEKQLKEAARAEAITGQSVVLVDNPLIKVQVTGTKPKVTYDPALAMDTWPEDLCDEVMVFDVDVTKIEAKKQLGLPADILELVEAARHEEPQTPQVRITFPERADAVPESAKLAKTGT